VEVIQLLLDSDTDKQSILERIHDGRLPIHCACRANAPVEVIQLLLDSDDSDNKKSLLEEDYNGWLPIHRACDADTSIEVIRLLLQTSLCNRIQQLGLDE
jgi:ankyrin repeat protein